MTLTDTKEAVRSPLMASASHRWLLVWQDVCSLMRAVVFLSTEMGPPFFLPSNGEVLGNETRCWEVLDG
jgi:hypothetical protein